MEIGCHSPDRDRKSACADLLSPCTCTCDMHAREWVLNPKEFRCCPQQVFVTVPMDDNDDDDDFAVLASRQGAAKYTRAPRVDFDEWRSVSCTSRSTSAAGSRRQPSPTLPTPLAEQSLQQSGVLPKETEEESTLVLEAPAGTHTGTARWDAWLERMLARLERGYRQTDVRARLLTGLGIVALVLLCFIVTQQQGGPQPTFVAENQPADEVVGSDATDASLSMIPDPPAGGKVFSASKQRDDDDDDDDWQSTWDLSPPPWPPFRSPPPSPFPPSPKPHPPPPARPAPPPPHGPPPASPPTHPPYPSLPLPHPPPSPPWPPPPPPRACIACGNYPLPTSQNALSTEKCASLLSDPKGKFWSLWAPQGWARRPAGQAACFEAGYPHFSFDGVAAGRGCDRNW